MQITRVSIISGIERTRELDITQTEYDAWWDGMLIQNAMPNLTHDEREFVVSGITPEEWDAEYGVAA